MQYTAVARHVIYSPVVVVEFDFVKIDGVLELSIYHLKYI